MSVLVVQHVTSEGPGLVGTLLAEASVPTRLLRPDEAIPEDALASASGLVVLGGPMGVYEADAYPRLVHEQALLRDAMARELPVVGICLGSQLLAASLGARVAPSGRKELGWLDVMLEADAETDPLFCGLPARFEALHWHGDVFELPVGARWLARSAMTAHQAFAVGTAWGLLFHLEAGRAEVERMADAFPDELREANVTREALLSGTHDEAHAVGRTVFGRFVELVRARRA